MLKRFKREHSRTKIPLDRKKIPTKGFQLCQLGTYHRPELGKLSERHPGCRTLKRAAEINKGAGILAKGNTCCRPCQKPWSADGKHIAFGPTPPAPVTCFVSPFVGMSLLKNQPRVLTLYVILLQTICMTFPYPISSKPWRSKNKLG